MRPKGSSARLEQRRRDAVAMLRRGVKAAAVARVVGVSLVSVGRWRQAAEAGAGAARGDRRAAAGGAGVPRLPDRAVDAAARGRGDRPPLRGELPPQPGLAHPAVLGLELPEARAAGPRAQRGGDRAVEARRLAAHKKKLWNPAAASCSSMRPG